MTSLKKTGFRRWLKGQMLKYMHRMITCKEFEDFILRYLDDELSDSQRRVFELHIRFCEECRDYLAAYRRSVEIGKAAMESTREDLPNEMPEDLIKAIIEARNY